MHSEQAVTYALEDANSADRLVPIDPHEEVAS
jgi:hypothetical protein